MSTRLGGIGNSKCAYLLKLLPLEAILIAQMASPAVLLPITTADARFGDSLGGHPVLISHRTAAAQRRASSRVTELARKALRPTLAV